MFRKHGLIAKIKDNYCIIVTTDGTYKRIPVPAGGARPGMEITYRDFDFYPLLKPVMLAASVLILLIGLTMFRQAAVPPAVAYVSLDINPSLEMAVDKDLQVVDVGFFNDDGVNMVQKADLEGKNLYEALKILVQKAIEQKYIKPDQKNLLVSTIAATTADKTGLDPVKLQQALEGAIISGGLTGEVKVYSVDKEVRTEAQQNGLSPGKFIIYEQVKESGAKLTVEEVKQNSIRKLVDIYSVKLLPNNKKIIIQKPNNTDRPRVLIEENDSPASGPDKQHNYRDELNEDKNENKNDTVNPDSGKKHEDDSEEHDNKNEKSGTPQINTDDRTDKRSNVKQHKEDPEDKHKSEEDKNKETKKEIDKEKDKSQNQEEQDKTREQNRNREQEEDKHSGNEEDSARQSTEKD